MILQAERNLPPRRWALVADLFLLLLVFAFTAWLNLQWVQANQGPPRDDDNLHLVAALQLREQVLHASTPGQGLRLFAVCPGHYPPLVYQVTFLFHQCAGVSHVVAIASLMPFLLVLMVSMYGVGHHVAGRSAGLACGFIAGTSPAVLELSRTYFLDMPATALVAASLCSVLHIHGFRHRGWSLLFGLTMGLGMLAKWVFLGFLAPWTCWALVAVAWNASRNRWMGIVAGVGIVTALVGLAGFATIHSTALRPDGQMPPFAPYLLASGSAILTLEAIRHGLRHRLADPGRALFNALEALAVAVIVAWPWYFHNAHAILEKVTYQAGVSVPYWETLRSNVHDLSAMIYLGPYLLILGTAVGLWQKDTRKLTAALVTASAVFVALISFLPPATRYVLPVLVFVLPLSMLWMKSYPRAGYVSACLFLVVGLWQAARFEIHTHFPEGVPFHRSTGSEWPVHASWKPVMPDLPEAGTYPCADVLRAMDLDPQHVPFVAFVGSRDSRGQLQPRSFAYYALLQGHRISIVEPQENLETGTRSDVDSCEHLVLIYRDLEERESLLKLVREHEWFPPSLQSVATFRFSPDVRAELLKR